MLGFPFFFRGGKCIVVGGGSKHVEKRNIPFFVWGHVCNSLFRYISIGHRNCGACIFSGLENVIFVGGVLKTSNNVILRFFVWVKVDPL